MPFGGANSERILILAPGGRDAEVAVAALTGGGISLRWCAQTC